MSTNVDTIRDFAQREYKWGFISDIEAESIPKGLNEDMIRLISAKKQRARVHAGVEAEGLSPLGIAGKGAGRAEVGQYQVRPSIIRTSSTTRLPSRSRRWRAWTSSIPEILRTYREAWHSAGGAEDAGAASPSMRSSTASRWRPPSRRSCARLGVIFCSFSEAVQQHPELVQKYLGSVVPYTDNFFASLNAAVFSDGSFVYVPKGVRCPDGALDVLPHQRRGDRPVRAHADRGRRRRIRQLSGRLHGADTRREPIARGGGRAGRAR